MRRESPVVILATASSPQTAMRSDRAATSASLASISGSMPSCNASSHASRIYLSAACFSAVLAELRKFRFADCKSNGPLQALETVTITCLALPEGGHSELKVNLALRECLEPLVGGLGSALWRFCRLRRSSLGLVALAVASRVRRLGFRSLGR